MVRKPTLLWWDGFWTPTIYFVFVSPPDLLLQNRENNVRNKCLLNWEMVTSQIVDPTHLKWIIVMVVYQKNTISTFTNDPTLKDVFEWASWSKIGFTLCTYEISCGQMITPQKLLKPNIIVLGATSRNFLNFERLMTKNHPGNNHASLRHH